MAAHDMDILCEVDPGTWAAIEQGDCELTVELVLPLMRCVPDVHARYFAIGDTLVPGLMRDGVPLYKEGASHIGEYLAHRRKLAGLMQSALAERVFVSRSCISMIENGARTVAPQLLEGVCRVLGISGDELEAVRTYFNPPGVGVALDPRAFDPQEGGKWVRARRMDADLTQAELARGADYSRVHLALVETGARSPSHSLIRSVGAVLQISEEELSAACEHFGLVLSRS
ncbi:helix-turn-helix domain-containing protein [Nocardia sp. NPDC052566]|uniref:helix-turn-helix domain-containing protein n=1 Tax=Nocardia sp. NPDC052566 TaxID=3364330 RepID=UPI0037C85075